MWISIVIAIIVTILFFSWGKNRNTAFQSKESSDNSYSGDGGSYDSSDDGDSSDGADSGGDGSGSSD